MDDQELIEAVAEVMIERWWCMSKDQPAFIQFARAAIAVVRAHDAERAAHIPIAPVSDPDDYRHPLSLANPPRFVGGLTEGSRPDKGATDDGDLACIRW